MEFFLMALLNLFKSFKERSDLCGSKIISWVTKNGSRETI